MIENHWQLQDAKNKFSNLVDKAQHNGPQVVTKHGKDAVVVLSIDEYKKLIKPKNNFAFGIGYKVHRFSTELRILTNRQLFNNYLYWTSEYYTYSAILGYSLF